MLVARAVEMGVVTRLSAGREWGTFPVVLLHEQWEKAVCKTHKHGEIHTIEREREREGEREREIEIHTEKEEEKNRVSTTAKALSTQYPYNDLSQEAECMGEARYSIPHV